MKTQVIRTPREGIHIGDITSIDDQLIILIKNKKKKDYITIQELNHIIQKYKNNK